MALNTNGPGMIANAGHFYLNHICALISQHGCCPGASEHTGEFYYPVAGQRSSHQYVSKWLRCAPSCKSV